MSELCVLKDGFCEVMFIILAQNFNPHIKPKLSTQ